MSTEDTYTSRMADALEVMTSTAFPDLSMQLEQIRDELRKTRKSDAKLLESLVQTLLLIGNQVYRGCDVREGGTDMGGHVGVGAGVVGVAPDSRGQVLDLVDVAHVSFFLSGLACGLAITSLIRGR